MSDIKQKLIKLEEIDKSKKEVSDFVFEMYANVKRLEVNKEFQDLGAPNSILEEALQYTTDFNKYKRHAIIETENMLNQLKNL